MDASTTPLQVVAALAALAMLACDDRAAEGLTGASGADDGGAGDAGVDGARHGAHFAVISTNYTGATAISLLDLDGDVLDDVWVSSATENPALRTPLAEDVVAQTVSGSRRYLTVLERGLGVVTRFDLDAGAVLGQVRADSAGGEAGGAFASNPQDVAFIDGGSAWISRWMNNPDPDAPTQELGNDLVEFDPATMARLAGRIDLSSIDVSTQVPQYDAEMNVVGMSEDTAFARPTGLVAVGNHLVVGLGVITEEFSYGPGAMAVVDPRSGDITAHVPLSPLRNCGQVTPIPGAPERVLVACIGNWAGLGPESGLAIVEVDADGSARVVMRYDLSDHGGAVVATQNVISLGGTLALGTSGGAIDAQSGEVSAPDAAYLIDLADGTQRSVLQSTGAFSLGVAAYDAAAGIVLLPDAGSLDAPRLGIHRLHLHDAELTPDDFITVADDTGLAARQVHRL